MVSFHSFRAWCRSEWQTPQKRTSNCTSCGWGSRRRIVVGASAELAPGAANALASNVRAPVPAPLDVACIVSTMCVRSSAPEYRKYATGRPKSVAERANVVAKRARNPLRGLSPAGPSPHNAAAMAVFEVVVALLLGGAALAALARR